MKVRKRKRTRQLRPEPKETEEKPERCDVLHSRWRVFQEAGSGQQCQMTIERSSIVRTERLLLGLTTKKSLEISARESLGEGRL